MHTCALKNPIFFQMVVLLTGDCIKRNGSLLSMLNV